jgi:hypothetical protein
LPKIKQTPRLLDRIELGAGQSIAAYWSISWQSLVALLVATMLIAVFASSDSLGGKRVSTFLGLNVLLLTVHALMVPRLVRKNYRTFVVSVIREGEQPARNLSPEEIASVCIRVLWPQIAFLAILNITTYFLRERLSEETIRGLTSLSLWGRFLLIGPLAIQGAMNARYSGFRLQAFRR